MANLVTTPTRTFTGTLVAICEPGQLDETYAALRALHTRAAVRPIVVTFGDIPQPPMRDIDAATVIEGLLPRYLDNVVAAHRVSSLPAMAWWRGGDSEVLTSLAPLVDRLVLDSPDPEGDWRAAARLVEVTSITDLRWTRLTRWRNLMAQFFDMPGVRGAAAEFVRLEIAAADQHGARLFAAWLSRRLPTAQPLEVRISPADRFVSQATLIGREHRLDLRLTAGATCVRAAVEGRNGAVVERTVSLGNQSLTALLEEEMRIRARDMAFENAVRSVTEEA